MVESLDIDPVLCPRKRGDGGGGIRHISRAEIAGLFPVKVFALEGECCSSLRFPLVDHFKTEEIGIPGECRVVGHRRDVRFSPGKGGAEEDGPAVPDLHRGFREDRERMRPVFRIGAEQLIVLALQRLDSQLKVDGKIREPGHLNPFFPAHPFSAHECAVIKRYVDEIPRMGMLGVDAADAALELPSLDLQAGGQGGSYEISFLYGRPAIRDGDVGVKVKIRVDRREDEQLRGIEIEPLVDTHGNVREPGDRSRIQFRLRQVRAVKERIDDQRDIRIRHRGTAEDAGQFGGRTLL